MDDDGDFEAPTFSLGIDLDDSNEFNDAGSVSGSDLRVEDSDPEPAERVFKRLRRGKSAASSAPLPKPEPQQLSYAEICGEDDADDDEEEIEDFSSQEDTALAKPASAQSQAMCSASKTSLPAQGSVVVKSIRKLQSDYQNQGSHSQIIRKGETFGDGIKLPKLTISPLRKFQLVDSDSEDYSDNHEIHTDSIEKDILPKKDDRSCSRTEPSGTRSVKESSSGSYQNDDIWKDFCLPKTKSFKLSTPVLDEVCEEYSQTLKEKNDSKYPEIAACISNNGRLYGKVTDVQNQPCLLVSAPPAHRYFFHNDMQIQNLVHSRLCNFCPLDILDNIMDDQPGSSIIDYRSQFNHGGTSSSGKTPCQKNNAARSSAKGCRKKQSTIEKVSEDSGSWVNPRVSASIPKDAGKRRVRADGSLLGDRSKKASMGRWFTGSDEKRVYVSTSGQELTGRLAYQHYKRESGKFRKSRKRAAAKKK